MMHVGNNHYEGNERILLKAYTSWFAGPTWCERPQAFRPEGSALSVRPLCGDLQHSHENAYTD